MADVVDKKTRSRMMSGIRGKNTKPEIFVRKRIHSLGFRYKLYDRTLPGKPDLVFPKYRAVIFVNGCFWHKHSCHLFKWPKTRKDFWHSKINKTKETDGRNIDLLNEDNWRILIIWECALKGKTRLDPDIIINETANWLKSDNKFHEIHGKSLLGE